MLPGPTQAFNVGSNLRLVPQVSKRDPDTFFSLFEKVAESRGWTDADCTLLLQCKRFRSWEKSARQTYKECSGVSYPLPSSVYVSGDSYV